MEKHKLEAQKRKISGRKVKTLRKLGLLPANIFGKEIKSLTIQVPVKAFMQVYDKAGETGIIELSVADGEAHPVLVHNLQIHPVTSQPLHVDFHRVNLTEKVKAMVPVVTLGEAPAVAQKIGLLLTPVNEIEVEALPADLLEKIEVDVTSLKDVDQEIKVKDLKVSDKVSLLAEPELVVAKIGSLVTEETKKLLEEEKAAAEAASTEAAAEKGEAPAGEAAPVEATQVPAEEAKPAEGTKPTEMNQASEKSTKEKK